MRRNILSSALILLLIIGVTSCGSKRKAAKPDVGSVAVGHDLLSTFELNNLDFITFSGRAKANVELNQEKKNVTLNVRMQRDKAIWISVTAMLGIEAARVLITPDSIKIMSRLTSEYLAKPYSYIYRYTNPSINFRMLQDILVGNISLSMLRTDQLQVASSEDDVQIIGVKDGLTFHYGVNAENRPFALNLMELGADQKLEAQFGEYEVFGGYNFPQRLTLDIQGKDMKVSSDMLYNRVEFNKSVDLPFTVPSRYQRID